MLVKDLKDAQGKTVAKSRLDATVTSDQKGNAYLIAGAKLLRTTAP